MRTCPALLLAGLLAAPAFGQPPNTYSNPAPPDRDALARLNLRTEWVAALPVDGRKDAVEVVQVVDDSQLFVQTRSGTLAAIDARTGAKQWSVRYPAGYANVYPVAVNDRFVFAVNISRLFCFHRRTGLQEFDYELKLYPERNVVPTAGPVCDRENVYVVVNGATVIGYKVPDFLRTGDRPAAERRNAARVAADRFGDAAGNFSIPPDVFDRPVLPNDAVAAGAAGTAGNLTPSLSALPKVTPPYSLDYRSVYATQSLSVVPSLRQPYQFRPYFLQFNQRTPSITVLPPSVARAYELANLRPRPVGPTQMWLNDVGQRVQGEPLRTVTYVGGSSAVFPYGPNRVWVTTLGADLLALAPATGTPQVRATLRDQIAAPMAGPVPFDRTGRGPVAHPEDQSALGFVGLVDGTLLAVDLRGGGPEGGQPGPARVEWRTTVGGLLNHRPVVTRDAVFASGDHAGVVKVAARTGDVILRTDANADQVLAANQEFLYVRDRLGNLLVYDARTPSDPATRRSVPVAALNVAGFNVPVTNEVTDRVFLTADGGALVCLRDASPKYAEPARVAPPAVTAIAPPGVAPPAPPAGGAQ